MNECCYQMMNRMNTFKKLSIILVFSTFSLLLSANNELLYFWSGAITAHSAKVNVVLAYPSNNVRVAMDKSLDFAHPLYSDYGSVTTEHGNAGGFVVEGLEPGTVYYYLVEINGIMENTNAKRGMLQTFEEGAFSYSFLLGACNFFPNNPVYDRMRSMPAWFYMNIGDLHYGNPNSKDVKMHREEYETRVLSRERETKLLHKMPIAYVWDDHDYCGDNKRGNDGCSEAAKQAYMEYVPHYPLGDPDGPTGIYQAFTVGRVHFIMSDVRSQRSDEHIMSREQMAWLKKEMLDAKEKNLVIGWITSVSYSGTKKDNWGGYTQDREEIGNFLKDNKIENLFILSGDAHMSAIDNGTHADFSTGQDNPFLYPIFQSAALNNVGSDKGGTFSEGGTFPNPPFTGQFGLVTVTDHGGEDICFNFRSFRLHYLFDSMSELLNFDFCRHLPPVGENLRNTDDWLLRKSDNRSFEIRSSEETDLDLKVFNMHGDVFFQQYIRHIEGAYPFQLSNLPSGEYFIKAEMGKTLHMAKISLP